MLKQRILIILLAVVALCGNFSAFVPVQAARETTKYEYYATGQDADSAKIYGANWAYMQFTAGAISHTATMLNVYIKRALLPGTVTVSLRHAAAGVPTGTDLVSTTFDGDVISTGYTMYSFAITETTLQSGQQYAIVIRAPAGDASNYIYWGTDAGGGIASAIYGVSTNGGLTFTDGATADALFEVWGYPSIEVYGAKVFTGYMTTGDWLVVADVRNIYEPYYPTGDPQSSFQLQLLNGATIVATNTFKAWDRQPLSIYLNAATAGTLTWGSAYKVRIQLLGSATVYNEYTLTTADWTAGSLYYLDGYVRSLAAVYEDYYSTTYLVLTAEKGNVLNQVGGAVFDRGIANLSTIRNNLFQNTYSAVSTTPGTFTHAGEAAIIWSDRVGATVAGRLTDIGTIFGGISGDKVLGFIILILWLICAMMVGTGHWVGGAIAGLPMIAIGIYFGGLGLENVLAIAGIAVVIIGRAIFLNNQG